MSTTTRILYARLATPDAARLATHENGKNSKEPLTAFNSASITFRSWLNSTFYVLNNGFTQIDAYRSFRAAAQQLLTSSEFDETTGTYVVKDDDVFFPEDVAACRLPYEQFNHALRQSASLYKAATDGSELLDPSALPLASQEEADSFAATFAASLPEPVMFPVEEPAEDDVEEKTKKKKTDQKNRKKDKDKKVSKPKEKENVEATLNQYIGNIQLRLLSALVLSEMETYQHGIRQLFVSYMTDDVLTGEPPSWSTICMQQLQLKPSDADTCVCALRVTPDLVPHREFQSILLALSPVSGCLLFPQFIELLWRCAAVSPLAHDDVLSLEDAEVLQNLFVHAGMRPDLRHKRGGARRREDAMNASTMGQKITASPLRPRSGFTSSASHLLNDDRSGSPDSMRDSMRGGDEELQQQQEVRIEVALRSLLDQLETNLHHQEENMRSVPGFGFPSASELPRRKIETKSLPHVWHPMPCVVREVCRAPDAPLVVENLMEAALSYHNSSQYDLAINAYISARSAWLKIIEAQEGKRGEKNIDEDDEETTQHLTRDIPPRASLFILCGIGSVHESAGNDEMALTCYLDAQRTALSRLSHEDADMAVAYSHLGSVCFHLGRFSTASRCYRVAVSIRQHLLGSAHPDCAASHSSLGATLCMLGPSSMVEAMYHMKLAAKNLKRQLGPTHPRTVVATRNAERARCRPTRLVQQQGLDQHGKAPSRYVSGMRPKTLSLRDDLTSFHPGGTLPGVTGKKAKGKKGKGKGKKKKKK